MREVNTLERPEVNSPPEINDSAKSGCCAKEKDIPDWENQEHGAYVSVTFVKLLVYLLYITIVCIITFGSTTPGSYFLTKVIYENFIDATFKGYQGSDTTFRTSSTINDFWAFSESAMLSGLYREEWHWNHDPYIKEPITSPKEGIMYDNLLVGRARLRQLRMIQDYCPAAKLVPLLSRTCYPEYMRKYEETNEFHRLLAQYEDEGWKYQTAEELNGTSFWGSLEIYSGGGSTLLLNTNPQDTKEQLFPLKNNLWITRATRVVFLDFTFFNSNINAFCTVRLAWEIPATGGVTTSWDIQIIQLVRYSTPHQKFILFCQILFSIFTGYYTIQEILNMRKQGFKKYVRQMWSWLGITILIISFFCITFNFIRYRRVNKAVESIVTESDKFVDFQNLGLWESIYNDLAACGIFLIWIKLLKYLSFNRSMSQLSGTISRSSKDIGGFGIIFMIVFMAFAQLGHVLFGTLVLEFSTYGRTVFTLLRFILGDFDYRQVEDANRLLGPIFYLAYVLFVFMILLNMFLAIINDSYQAVREEIETKGNEIELFEFLQALVCRKKRPTNEAVIAAKTVNDIYIDPSEIKNNLRKKNFSDVEMEMFLARFDLDEHDNLDTDEAHKLLSDVTRNNYRSKKVPGGHKRNDMALNNVECSPITTVEQKARAKKLMETKVQEITNRVGVIETAVVELMPRIDNILASINQYYDKKMKLSPVKKVVKESYEDFF